MKGILTGAAMRLRLSKRANHFEKFDNRTGPTVGKNERLRILVA